MHCAGDSIGNVYDFGPDLNVYAPASWVCVHDGPVDVDTTGPVPACATCGTPALMVDIDQQTGRHTFYTPSPAACPNGHRWGPRRLTITWRGCLCPAAQLHHGGHTVYICSVGECRAEIVTPACTTPERD